jgi:TPR repeat protein
MKNSFRNTCTVAMAVTLLSALPLRAGEQKSNEQCSLAVFAKTAPKLDRVCDEATVRKLAKNGQVFEQNQLGMASVLGVADGSTVQDALKWFEKASHQGYAPAQVNLAVMYSNGWGTAPNQAAALHWLHAAADQGYAGADYNLGVMYMEGRGVPQDYAEAMRYFQKGAEGGDTRAQTNVGFLFDHGLGVKRDYVTASNWYRRAAEAGNALAQNNLADLILRGEGIAQNDSEAFQWFEKAAVQGNTGAWIKLGYLYANGRGTQKDLQLAYEWILAASLAGDQRGQYLIKPLESSLSAAQLRTAQDRAHVLFSNKGTEMSATLKVDPSCVAGETLSGTACLSTPRPRQ